MSINICMCGAQAGYLHHEACPYPLYRGTDRQMGEWEKLYLNRKAGLNQLSPLPDAPVAPQHPADNFFSVR